MYNIFTNVGGGYAAKYYNGSSAIDAVDYNDYYTVGNDLALYESTVCSDLSELQSASGMDQHSLSVDPGFVSDDDLHLNSPAVTEHATPIPFVTTDIDGEERDPSSPDMGADEYGAVGNHPPERVNPIADWTIEEDCDTTAIARLDTVFTDPNPGDDLNYTVISDTSSVKAFVIDTVLKVKPDTNFYGLAEIIVRATDPADVTASDTFNLTINNVQDPPVAVDDQDNTEVNTYVDVDVLNNDFDADNDTLKITHVTDGNNGTAGVLAGYVIIRYTPDPDFVGKDTISYGIRDGHGNYDTASVYLTVSFVGEGFVVTDLALDSISHASVAWGDYDADGDLDLLMTGWLGSNSEYITKIYQNNDGVLEDTEMNLQGVMAGSDKSCGWTDFNNDGLLDFIITGAKDGQPDEYYTMLYKQVEGTFVETDLGMHALTSGSVDWGDYDHDGDYDLLINGKGSGSEYAGIYINKTNVSGAFEYNNYGFETVWSSAANWGDFDGDGDLDVLSSGLGATKSQYKNDLPGFSNVQSVLNSIQGRTADVGDFDMDGDLDIVMAGDNADTAYSCIFECVTHEGPATWAYSLKSNIQNIKSGSVAWGDYDNDGDPDLIVSGTKIGLEAHTVLYENHEGSFWPDDQDFPDLGRSAAAWADYDNDGDLDLLLTGWGEDGPVSAIFRNNRDQSNTPPEAPEALAVEAGMDSVRLIWHSGSDNETTKAGLSYNLRMGTTPGGSEIISSLSLPDGYRQVPKMGNAGLDTTYTLYDLQPNTTYYWSVQSVDNCFVGSEFAEENSFSTSPEIQITRIYVDQNASGNNNGTSWENAFSNLQDALDLVSPGDTIWVAEGTYRPSKHLYLDESGEYDSRQATFLIPESVSIIGGFKGTESALDQRDPKRHETILSGDIGTRGYNQDNAYHVVCFVNAGNYSLLDGFIITEGKHESDNPDLGTNPFDNPNWFGSGIYIEASGDGNTSSPTIVNCIIQENEGNFSGAGICVGANNSGISRPHLLNCIIRANKMPKFGAGLYIVSKDEGACSPVLTNCIISGNKAVHSGGGIGFNGDNPYSHVNSVPILKNCTFSGNYALDGGAVYINGMDPVFVNCISWNNKASNVANEVLMFNASPCFFHCDIEGGREAFYESGTNTVTYENNLQTDPMFLAGINPEDAPEKSGDFRLREGSPCIDAGLNDSVSLNRDMDGNDRIQNGTVDMGAYEGAVLPETIYVDQHASGAGDGTSWEDAYTDIQPALDREGYHQIWIANGVYYPSKEMDMDGSGIAEPREATFFISEGKQLYGGFSGNETSLEEREPWDQTDNATILSGDIGDTGDESDNAYHVVSFVNAGNNSVLDGFIISGGNANAPSSNEVNSCGGGIYIYSSGPDHISNPNIHKCIIRLNEATLGAGIFNGGVNHGVSSPMLLNCQLKSNKAGFGGALYNMSRDDATCNPSLINCVVSGNYALAHGGGLHNFSKAGGRNNPKLVNCTFSGNFAELKGGALINRVHTGGSCSPVLTNCILWENEVGQSGDEVSNLDASPAFTYCNIKGGSDAFGSNGTNYITYRNNLDADPLFVDIIDPEQAPTTEGNLHLAEGSPCIDAGINDSITVDNDADGEDRIQNGTVDMGAYEGAEAEEILFVDADANGSNDGSSWANAFTDLQDALDYASLRSSIWVAAGTYYPSKLIDMDQSGSSTTREATFQIPDYVSVLGGFAGTETSIEERVLTANKTILSGDIGEKGNASDNAYHVVYFHRVSKHTLLDGVTVTDGRAYGENINSGGGGIFINAEGRYVYSFPVISNCVIQSNYAFDGGGIFISGKYGGNASPMILNCKIRGNYAQHHGAGILALAYGGSCNPVLINCIISGNKSVNYGANGGGILWTGSVGDSSPKLINCTITGNYAGWVGGGIYNGSNTPVVINCILWNNRARNDGDQVFNWDASPTFTYCDIEGGSEAFANRENTNITYQHNLDADPLFVSGINPVDGPTTAGNFHLQEGSPCIDAGTNDPVKVSVDLDLNDRIKGSAVDMGAYESEEKGKIPDFINTYETIGLRIYPNPTRGLLKIELSEDSQVEMLEVIDITGVAVDSRKVTGRSLFLDLSTYPDGIYFIRTTSGGNVSTVRIIKY
ncbi:MAG: choice-of-anchor Q domain-containing protein [Bacteroidota bacterium]